MSQIKATPEELRGDAQFVNGQATSTRENISALRNRIDSLHGKFEGQAAQTFDAKFTEWQTSANNLVTALEGLASWLSKAADTIEQTDQQLASGLG